MNEIGTNIKRAREAKGWSQSELARRMGVSPQAVQKWENGGLPRGNRVTELAELLSMTVSALLNEAEGHLRVTEPPAAYEVTKTVKAASRVISLDDVFAALSALGQLEQIPGTVLNPVVENTKSRLALELQSVGVGVKTQPVRHEIPDDFITPNTGEPDGFRQRRIDEPYYVAPILKDDVEAEQKRNEKKKA